MHSHRVTIVSLLVLLGGVFVLAGFVFWPRDSSIHAVGLSHSRLVPIGCFLAIPDAAGDISIVQHKRSNWRGDLYDLICYAEFSIGYDDFRAWAEKESWTVQTFPPNGWIVWKPALTYDGASQEIRVLNGVMHSDTHRGAPNSTEVVFDSRQNRCYYTFRKAVPVEQ